MTKIQAIQIQLTKMHIRKTTPSEESDVRVLIQFDLLMMSTVTLETCRDMK